MMDRHGLRWNSIERAIKASHRPLVTGTRAIEVHVINAADFYDLGGRSEPGRLYVDDSEKHPLDPCVALTCR